MVRGGGEFGGFIVGSGGLIGNFGGRGVGDGEGIHTVAGLAVVVIGLR